MFEKAPMIDKFFLGVYFSGQNVVRFPLFTMNISPLSACWYQPSYLVFAPASQTSWVRCWYHTVLHAKVNCQSWKLCTASQKVRLQLLTWCIGEWASKPRKTFLNLTRPQKHICLSFTSFYCFPKRNSVGLLYDSYGYLYACSQNV